MRSMLYCSEILSKAFAGLRIDHDPIEVCNRKSLSLQVKVRIGQISFQLFHFRSAFPRRYPSYCSYIESRPFFGYDDGRMRWSRHLAHNVFRLVRRYFCVTIRREARMSGGDVVQRFAVSCMNASAHKTSSASGFRHRASAVCDLTCILPRLAFMTCACMRSRHSSHRQRVFPLPHPPANSSPNTVFKTRSPSMARLAPVCATSGIHEPYARAIPRMKSSANSRGITLRKAETLSAFRAESHVHVCSFTQRVSKIELVPFTSEKLNISVPDDIAA